MRNSWCISCKINFVYYPFEITILFAVLPGWLQGFDFVFLAWIFYRYVFLVWVFFRYVFHSYHSWGQLRIISLIEFEIPQLNGGFIAKLRLDCVLFSEKHGEFSELGACFWGITFSECCIKILVTNAVVTRSYLEFSWTTYY